MIVTCCTSDILFLSVLIAVLVESPQLASTFTCANHMADAEICGTCLTLRLLDKRTVSLRALVLCPCVCSNKSTRL